MEKYKILVADDESDIREGIVSRIDWETLGFTVEVEAENGQDAIERAESAHIDVVLTDIRMPFMNGLDMCARLAVSHPGIKFIILTGYDEFEYAQTAIKLNAVEYVLKPVNVAELSEVLMRVKRQLDESTALRRDIDRLTRSYEKSLPLMREHFLTELIWGVVPEREIAPRLSRFGLSLGAAPHCAVAVFEPDTDSLATPFVSWTLAPVSIKQIVEERLQERCNSAVFIGSSAITAITSWDNPAGDVALVGLADVICAACLRALNVRVTVGVGRARPIADLRLSFLEARTALDYKATIGAGKAIYIQDAEPSSEIAYGSGAYNPTIAADTSPVSREEIGGLAVALKFGIEGDIERASTEAARIMSRLDASGRKLFSHYVYGIVFRVVYGHALLEDKDVSEIMGADGLTDPNAMSDWIRKVCELTGKRISAKRTSAAKTLADEARAFVESKYRDKNLSVGSLCEHLHISPSYLSQIFRQEIGQTFVQYLTGVRLDRAVELLRATDEKTYEIALRVGYDEPNYFSYAFKKRMGVSPTRFRQNLNREQSP